MGIDFGKCSRRDVCVNTIALMCVTQSLAY